MLRLAGVPICADVRGSDANNAGVFVELDAILAVVMGSASLSGGRVYLGLSVIGVLVIQSGVIYAFYTASSYPLAAVGVELDAIAAVVIATLFGRLIEGTIQILISLNGSLASWWRRSSLGGSCLCSSSPNAQS